MGTFVGRVAMTALKLASKVTKRVAKKKKPKKKKKKPFNPKTDPTLIEVRKRTAQSINQTRGAKKMIKSSKKILRK